MADYDFRIIRPVEITDAILTSSNVPEAVAATWSGATTYALGDLSGYAPVAGQPQTVYRSLQATNLNHDPATSPTWWLALGVVYPIYSAAVTYALGDRVSSIGTNVHLIYESLAAGNIGNALTNTAKWVHVGSDKVTTGTPYNSTNRWKMFDQSYSSQTENATSIVVTLTPGVLINAAAFLNVEGRSIRVQQTVSGYDETIQLQTHPVLNWYDWYYEELIQEDDTLFTGIPPYADSALTITISGDAVKCGICVIGKEKLLGQTQQGMSKSIQDYSVVSENAFGDIELIRRAYAERLNLDVHLDAGTENEVVRQLKAHRSEPLVFVGSTQFSMSIVYGFLGSWQVPCELTGGLMPVEIKGLT